MERSVRARSISRSSLPRKTLQNYFSTMETTRTSNGSKEGSQDQGRTESEPDRVSGSEPQPYGRPSRPQTQQAGIGGKEETLGGEKGEITRRNKGGVNQETTKCSPIKIATWNKGRSCIEKLIKKRDELEILLHVYSIDILAVTEANFDLTQTEEECKIKGYDMHWEKGRKQIRRKNARVVTYVRQGLDVKVENKFMEEDLCQKSG